MTNNLTNFQTIINNILQDLIIEEIVVVYLDKILIFIQTLEKHTRAVQQVLEVLAEYKLFFHLKKYKFEQKRIKYLGLGISENKVDINPVKVFRVYEQPVSKFQSDIQVFLGFVYFYYYFIQDFSAIAYSLFDLTRSSSTQTQENKQQEFFDALKKVVTSIFILVSPDNTKPFYIEVDSLDFTTGAILSQQLEADRKQHPVVFFNKFLFLVKQNYEIHDKEILAIICALKEQRQ